MDLKLIFLYQKLLFIYVEIMMEYAVFYLISNVVRYGADGKYLGIFLHNDEKGVCIDVIDKGKGIDKQFADRIFDCLFTLEDSRNRTIQGSGLGLTIAKNNI